MQQVTFIMCHMNTVTDVIQQVIKDVRRQNGWTQAQLAQKLGKDPSWVSRWEKGIPKEMPPPEDFRAICLISGVPMRTLIERIGYLDPEETEPGIAYAIQGGTVRATLLDVLDGASDADVQTIVAIAGAVPMAHRSKPDPMAQSREHTPTTRSA